MANAIQKLGYDEDKVKKTVVPMIDYLASKVDTATLKEFVEKFGLKSTTSGQPREAVKLFDANGNVLGRRCTVTGKWFPIDRFYKSTTFIKEADKLKQKYYAEGQKIKKEAEKLLKKAREEEDPAKKLELFEQYDAQIEKAKEIANKDVSGEVEFEGGFDTIEDLAKSLGVEVITSAPKESSEN